MELTKKDWKLYREKISGWQEDYMERLVERYSELLSGNLPASSKFWELEKRINTDKRTPGVRIELKKSTMIWDIVSLIGDGVINFDDLDEFSDELKEAVRIILERTL
ncbi:multidrug transporter [Sedimentibacter sp.]|uniref:multidrug transporter n=1 Tax=Sedimentibacter sp. TaxID=1960295 RepID=UPI0028973D71|nr:multidrug transporter [Sedimentibacter sp.]